MAKIYVADSPSELSSIFDQIEQDEIDDRKRLILALQKSRTVIQGEAAEQIEYLAKELINARNLNKLIRPDDQYAEYNFQSTKVRHECVVRERYGDFEACHKDRENLIEHVESLSAEAIRLEKISKAASICVRHYGLWPPSLDDRRVAILERTLKKYK